MENNGSKKSKQLGMPFGTASARLKKSLMFRMAQKLGEDVCFKCGKRILNLDEFTIEHKAPWLDRGPQLFWDLDNIAFSHAKCNRADRPIRKGSKTTGWG